jgi:hypothetical protein
MGGAALASVLHVAGHPLPSHHCCPIVVIQSPSSNRHPRIATVVFINIVAVIGGNGIIAVAIAIAIAIAITVAIAFAVSAVAISAIAVVIVIVDVASLTTLRQRHCHHAPWRPIGGAGPNHATEASPMACGWRPYPWIGRTVAGGVDTSS